MIKHVFLALLATIALVVALTTGKPQAQAPSGGTLPAVTSAAPGIKRTILTKADVPGSNFETIVALVEVAAGFQAGRHTHPGDVTGYVMEGDFYMTFDGQPERHLKAGEALLVPSGKVHNEGTKDKPAKLIAVYVVEKGKALAAPVK